VSISCGRRLPSRALLAGICATCTVALLDYTLVTGAAAERSLAWQRTLLSQRRDRVEEWWARQLRLIQAHVRDPVFQRQAGTILSARRLARRGGRRPEAAVLSRLVQPGLDAREFALLTGGGITASSTNPDRIGWYQPLQNTTTAIDPQRPELTRLNYFTNPDTGLPTVSIAYPLGVGPGGRGGYYVVDLDLAALSRLISGAAMGDQAPAEKPAEQPSIYAVARTSLDRTTRIHPERPEWKELPNLESRGITQALDGSTGSALYLNGSGVPVVGAFAPAGQVNLAILVERPQREVFEAARRRVGWFVAVGMLICLLPLAMRSLGRERG
jgi:hypothetical protein